MTFGQHLRKIRKNNNLSQSELGKKLGVSQITVCGWENYGKVPDVMILANIIKEFGVPFEVLFEDYL